MGKNGIAYRGFRIVPKTDFGMFGYWIGGKIVRKGWVVCFGPGHGYEGCNAMPGATWGRTVPEAKGLVDAYIRARGNADRFWKIVRGSA